jgi:arylsulfatase
VNGKLVSRKHVGRTTPVTFSWDETLDIGEDAGTAVGDYSSPFSFSGEIQSVSIDIAPEELTPSSQEALHKLRRAAWDVSE